MPSDRVIDLLRRAYGHELDTEMIDQTNAIVLDGVRAEGINQRLQQDIQEELSHAQQRGNRLKQLDARPPSSAAFTARQDSLQPPDDSTGVRSVIRGVLDAEADAIATYRSLSMLRRRPTIRAPKTSLSGFSPARRPTAPNAVASRRSPRSTEGYSSGAPVHETMRRIGARHHTLHGRLTVVFGCQRPRGSSPL